MIKSMLVPNGLFVLSKEKELVLAEIGLIQGSFGKLLNDKQAMSECRACKERIIRLLENYFVETHAKHKAINLLSSVSIDNPFNARFDGDFFASFLRELKRIVYYSIHFDDLPSCRKLLDYSTEEAAQKSIDLITSGIVKVLFKAASIGENIYHFKEIEDVRTFYSDMLSGIQNDSSADGYISNVELIYMNKCKEELEYCNLATLKVTGKLTKDILDERKAITEGFEKKYRSCCNSD